MCRFHSLSCTKFSILSSINNILLSLVFLVLDICKIHCSLRSFYYWTPAYLSFIHILGSFKRALSPLDTFWIYLQISYQCHWKLYFPHLSLQMSYSTHQCLSILEVLQSLTWFFHIILGMCEPFLCHNIMKVFVLMDYVWIIET